MSFFSVLFADIFSLMPLKFYLSPCPYSVRTLLNLPHDHITYTILALTSILIILKCVWVLALCKYYSIFPGCLPGTLNSACPLEKTLSIDLVEVLIGGNSHNSTMQVPYFTCQLWCLPLLLKFKSWRQILCLFI